MGDIAASILWVLVAITILVFVHEMGHFLAARLFKIRIERFSVGFPPTIFKKQVGETEWAIGATPLGGYVKIAGMVDESLDTDFESKEPEPWEFRSKPVWQRVIVISAGVIFNVLLAAVIFIGLRMALGEPAALTTEDGLVYVPDTTLAATEVGLRSYDRIIAIDGKPFNEIASASDLPETSSAQLTWEVVRDGQALVLTAPKSILPPRGELGDDGVLGLGIYNWPAVLGEVRSNSPADHAGLQEGDHITAVDGEAVTLWMDFTQKVRASGGDSLHIFWDRPETGESFSAYILPESPADGEYLIGIQVALVRHRTGPGRAIVTGITETALFTGAIVVSLKNMITGQESVRESLGGPVMVAKLAGEAAQAGAEQFWRLVALLSITLAIVNILPVPALDGGHLVFLIYEGVRRREPSLKVRMAMQQFGMALLLILMAFLVFNDLDRIFQIFR